MILTRADDARVRRARARMLERGEPIPRYSDARETGKRGGGINPAFIRLDPPPPPTKRARRRK